MLAFVAFVVGVLVVGGLLFLGASVLLGPGRDPAARPSWTARRWSCPTTGRSRADDVRALRISVAFRGYRMTEVDWLLDQFALVLDERDAEIAALTARLAAHPAAADPAKDDDDAAPADEPAATRRGGAAPCLSWSSGSTSTPRRSGSGRC